LLKKEVTDWTTETITNGVYFVHPACVAQYTANKDGVVSSTAQISTTYDYLTGQQGGAQYGNLTRVHEYQNGQVYRHRYYWYYPNATEWIVDRPAVEAAYADNGQGSMAAESKTRYIYDSLAAGYSTPPTRGNLVMTKRWTGPGDEDYIIIQVITYSVPFSMPVEVSDANGHVMRTDYDWAWLHPITVSDALEHATAYSYHPRLWNVTRVQGPNGSATGTDYEYDNWARLTKIIRPSDDTTRPTVRYVYHDEESPLRIEILERVTSGQDAVIPTLRFYNGIGQLVQENRGTSDSSQMTVRTITYNAHGQKEREYVPFLAGFSAYHVTSTGEYSTTYGYDPLGRVAVVTNPDGSMVRTFYDGLRRTVVDENGHQKAYDDDAFGRLVQVKEYQGAYPSASEYATTQYGYNRRDLLTTVTDTVGNVTTITYDPLGRKTGMTDPDMGMWSYTYDNAGNLKTQTDARGQRTCFYYDALNRITGSGLAVIATWQYDERGRVSSDLQGIPGSDYGVYQRGWEYNAADQVVTQMYPWGTGGLAGIR
jgi:YD repeat-containing protein